MTLLSLLTQITVDEDFTTEFKRSSALNLNCEICVFAHTASEVILSKLINGEVVV
ncbi:MAG: hypothetical protein PHP32_07575 [Candidatus Izemoplasmatales bacterium]|jgi:hypothetical protein|nr:hypothetical protein [Candidatus Izemoplasmatales bacterium]